MHTSRRPPLDPDFLPCERWCRTYEARVAVDPQSIPLALAVTRPDDSCHRIDTTILQPTDENRTSTLRFVERQVKSMLWIRGGSTVFVGGSDEVADHIARSYSPVGSRSFDCDVVARRAFLDDMKVVGCGLDEVPATTPNAVTIGGHFDGCRVGFDLGGSDRKCAAVIDGRVVHSEETPWDPYFRSDPRYHFEGIMDSIARAAAHLPRVEAIGGSAAGVTIDNEPRVGSLFRGIADDLFETEIRPIYKRVRSEWGEVPFEVVNDGEVTALEAAISLGARAPIGIAMGTSLASGFADAQNHITTSLNELAFVPVDLRADAPRDEWSADIGCGVQYLSQQAVARLAPAAGINLPAEMHPAEKLVKVQDLMSGNHAGVEKIFRTIGIYLGWSIPWWARWIPFESVLVLGRVTSGPGGGLILEEARRILREEFPDLADRIEFVMPDETTKRHGQAIAAASLPRIKR